MNTVEVTATRAQLKRTLSKLPARARKDVLTRCGLAVLGRIKRAFVVKARGGVDEAGDSWKPSKRAIEQHGETLRDTGLLLNSLTPMSGSSEQVFSVQQDAVTVGTRRKGAAAHHKGTKRLPQRRLWPEPKRWPATWWQDILEQARQGMLDAAMESVR